MPCHHYFTKKHHYATMEIILYTTQPTKKNKSNCTKNYIVQYCDHQNIYYISQSTDNSPWNCASHVRNKISVWIFSIGIKEPTTLQQVMEAISSQQLGGKCNKIQVITARRYRNTVRVNIQENRYIFNQIRHIQEISKNILYSYNSFNTRSYW